MKNNSGNEVKGLGWFLFGCFILLVVASMPY